MNERISFNVSREQLILSENSTNIVNRKHFSFRLFFGILLGFFSLFFIVLSGFIVFQGTQNPQQVKIYNIPKENATLLHHAPDKMNLTSPTRKTSILKTKNEKHQEKQDAKSLANLLHELSDMSSGLKNFVENAKNVSSPDKLLDASIMLDEIADDFNNEVLHLNSSFIRILLFENKNSVYYGRIYVGEKVSPFNTIFDSSFNMISLSTINNRSENCPTQHCYVSKEYNNGIKGDVETISSKSHSSSIHFHKDKPAEINSQTVVEDYHLSYSKEDQIDGIFGLGYYSSNSVSPVEQFFTQNPHVKRIISLWYLKSFGKSPKMGEMMVGNIDKSRFTGNISYVPVETHGYWKTLLDSVSIDISHISFISTSAHFDSKSNCLIGPEYHVHLIAKSLGFKELSGRKFVLSNAKKCKRYQSDQVIKFRLGNILLKFTADDFIERNGEECKILLTYHENANEDWTFGVPYFRKYYTVFDIENNRIGIARQFSP